MSAALSTNTNQLVRFAAYLNGTFIPTWDGEVELSAFGIADSCSVTTFLADAPVDYGAVSQSGKYLPLTIKVGTIGSAGLNCQLLASYLEEIDTVYDEDTVTIHGRGVLAPLIDQRLTAKLNQNQDITTTIGQIIGSVPGLQYSVNDGQPSGMLSGKLLTTDHVSLTRSMRAMDYINILANALGWRVRVVGAKVIVGPPSNGPVLSKVWGGPSGGVKLNIKHNALHAHNIHVRVVSYQARPKRTYKVKAPIQTTASKLPNTYIPVQVPATTTSSSGPTNPAGLASGNIPQVSEQEEYTFFVPGKNANDCDIIAAKIQEEISRHEFIAELEWAPTASEIQFLCANGVEWQLQLSGCSQASHNQTYHPKRINWTFSESAGLTVKVLAVNHLLPTGAESETI